MSPRLAMVDDVDRELHLTAWGWFRACLDGIRSSPYRWLLS